MLVRYCRLLDEKFKEARDTGRYIVHFCSREPRMRSNAAFLICAYQVVVLHVSPEAAFSPFREYLPTFLPFCDASGQDFTGFDLTILDCLEGLQLAIRNKWFNWRHFDIMSYEFFSTVEAGDMNW